MYKNILKAYDVENIKKNKNKKILSTLGKSTQEIREKLGIKEENNDLSFEDYLNTEFEFLDSITKEFEDILGVKKLSIYYSSEEDSLVLGKIY